MKKLLFLVLAPVFLYAVSGCKTEPVLDPTVYYIKCNANGTDLDFSINKNDAKHPTNVSFDNVGDHHYLQGDNGTNHIHFGFVADIKDFSTYTGGTYRITRMDYGNGVGFGSFIDMNGNLSETYETDYGVDTGVITVSYNRGNNQLSGSFSFTALQTNPQPNVPPNTMNITNGTFLIKWFPY